MEMFFQVLGWQVAGGEKAVEHANDFEVLGVNFKLSSGLDPAHLLVAAKAGCIAEIVADLRTFLDEGRARRQLVMKVI
eukprot:1256106-Amphidinium_carterae.1